MHHRSPHVAIHDHNFLIALSNYRSQVGCDGGFPITRRWTGHQQRMQRGIDAAKSQICTQRPERLRYRHARF